MRGILGAVLIAGETSLETALDHESQAFALCASTSGMREGAQAFLDNRKPAFTGT